jgi:teichuronic acid biosynthesis glycosyltransferase TuaC
MSGGRVRVMTFTSLYPNAAEPGHGLFVGARVQALAQIANVEVVAPVPWSPPIPGLPARFYRCQDVPAVETRDGLVVHHPRFTVIPRVLKSTDPALMALTCAPAVKAIQRRFDFAVIDAHWACPDGVAAAMLARVAGVPFSITVRGDDINVFADEPRRRPLIRWALRRAGLVIALSNELADKVVALGADPDRVRTIPNGVDTARFRFVDQSAARRTLGIGPDETLLFTAGRLHTSKGFPVLVEALARLASDHPRTRLVIAGRPDDEADATPAIKEAVGRFGLDDRVALIGGVAPDDLVTWYNAADLFCLATTREGSANVLLEALACGLPCVTTAVGGNRDAVSSDEHGILTRPDAAAMADAIDAALAKTWNRRRLADQAAARGWNVVARECLDGLESLLTPVGVSATTAASHDVRSSLPL